MAKSDSTAIRLGPSNVVRLGVIGCGEISQVAHIPMLNLMSDYYRITYLCDVSKQSLEHCAPPASLEKRQTCVCGKATGVIVPRSGRPAGCGGQVEGVLFVGYMRRYAPAFSQAIAEIGNRSKIQYARVRDIIGPNAHSVKQSGTFSKKFSDFEEADADALKAQDDDINQQALVKEFGVPLNEQSKRMLLCLGGLGSHDLSAMREALGMPKGVIGADLRLPIWSAMLRYDSFTVVYESGINSVPVFDAHIDIYTDTKIVRINYDTPYVKGLPTTIMIRERVEGTDTYQERTVRPTYEDSYTIEFKKWHQCITQGKTPKTTIADAREDLDIFKMLMQASFAK